jgi:hypothetical protein
MESSMDAGLALTKELMLVVQLVETMVETMGLHLVLTTGSLMVYHLAPTMGYLMDLRLGHLSQPELLAQTEEAQ